MTTTPLATKMWSRDAFDIASPEGAITTSRIINAYQVTVPADYTVEQVEAVQGVPSEGESFAGLPDMIVTNRNYTRASPILWIATVTYEGVTTGINTQQPPDIEWTDVESEEPIDQDWDGKPIVTVNNEPIDGVTMKIADNILNVKRLFRDFNPHITHQYRHSVNSDNFASYPPGTARLVAYRGKLINRNVWEVTARIEFRYPYNTTPERAWYARVRHEGYMVLTGAGSPTRATDGYGQDVTRPVLLTPDGREETNADNANWLEFRRYGALPYNALGLLD